MFAKSDEIPSLPAQVTEDPENHWSCTAHLSAEGMLTSAVIKERQFKHSPSLG